ncbi:MAG: primosomal protein, partial [Bacteroidota bacterium]
MLFAEVIIPLAIPKTYTYGIPDTMESQVAVGMRVEVTFGQKKRYAGIIKSITETPPSHFTPKNIIQLLDSAPVVFEKQLQLWNWISNYYMCSEGEVMAAALPAQLKLSSETILVYNEDYGDDFSDLDDQEYLVAEGLLLKKELKLDEVQDILDISRVYPVVKRLIEKRLCFASESIKEKYIPKKEKRIQLHPRFHEEEKLAALLNDWNNRAPKQLDLLLAFLHIDKTKGEVSQSDLLQKSGASAAQLKSLIEKEILQVRTQQVDRIQFAEKQVKIDFELSAYQQNAFNQLKTLFEEKNVCLVHGVTSSGKTLLYIKLIEEQILSGNQVLYLLPEIALTAQIIRRLEKHFGGYIAIYHSKFNPNERVDLWNRVRSGEIRVVLGARSSIFLPFSRLSLIIVDEEHDSSFKQYDPAPRYSAKDAALYYAR